MMLTAIESEWEHSFVETNNIRLHCVTQGEGDLVILLHGFPEFWYSWRYQIPTLSRYFKVVVPDLRGYNDSDKPGSGYDLDTLTNDIQGLINRLGYTHAHIVGHDWGGAIAWNFAQKFPQSIDRLAILNATHPQRLIQEITSNLDQFKRSWPILAFQVPGLPEWLIQQDLAKFVKNVFQENAIRKSAFTMQDTKLYEEALAKPGVLGSAINYYRQILSPWNWLKNWGQQLIPISSQTLILWGQEDHFLSQKLIENLDQLIKAPFQVKLIPNCGHWVQMEAPQTVNRELLSFLRNSH